METYLSEFLRANPKGFSSGQEWINAWMDWMKKRDLVWPDESNRLRRHADKSEAEVKELRADAVQMYELLFKATEKFAPHLLNLGLLESLGKKYRTGALEGE